MSTAAQTRNWMSAAARAQTTVIVNKMPETITVQHVQGFKHTMRVGADEEIVRDAHYDAVLMGGGPA